MTDQTKSIPEGIQVEKAVIKKGEVESILTNKDAWSAPAPRLLKIVVLTIFLFCSGAIVLVGATDVFSGRQAKVASLLLGAVQLFCASLIKAIGVVDKKE